MNNFKWPYQHYFKAQLPHAHGMPLSLAIGITAPFGVRTVYARPFYVSRKAIIARHLKGVRPGWYVGLHEGAEFQVFIADFGNARRKYALNSFLLIAERKNKSPYMADMVQNEQAVCLPGRLDGLTWKRFKLGGHFHYRNKNSKATVTIKVLGVKLDELPTTLQNLPHERILHLAGAGEVVVDRIPMGEVTINIRTHQWLVEHKLTHTDDTVIVDNMDYPVSDEPKYIARRNSI